MPENTAGTVLQNLPLHLQDVCSFLHTWATGRWGRPILQATALLCALAIALGLMALALNGAICLKTKDRIKTITELAEMGEFDYVIVLGCKVYSDGRLSDRLADRVTVGISVFESGIGETLLMSGDRQEDGSYDEVGAMQQTAVAAGIAEERIEMDPRGYSTYESLVRLAEVYHGKRIVIITQEYHLYRALYIAEKLGMEAYGVSADLQPYRDQTKCELRELAARIKDVWYVQTKHPVDCTKA